MTTTKTVLAIPIDPTAAPAIIGAEEYCASLILEALELLHTDCAVQDPTAELGGKMRNLRLLIGAIRGGGNAEHAEAA